MRRYTGLLPFVSLIGGAGCSSSDEPAAQVEVQQGRPQGDLPSDEEIATEAPGASDEQRTCLGETRAAELIGLDVFVLLDISSSMSEQLPRLSLLSHPQTKWDAVKQALEAFVRAPESAEIGLGLQYFPQQKPDVPPTCKANAECGAGAPCSSSICVRPVTVAPYGTVHTPARPAGCVGPSCFCSSDADCPGAGENCREMNGQCVVPGQGFLPLPRPLAAFCNADSDCAGLNVNGIACEPRGICENSIAGNTGLCSPTIPCLPGGGACLPLLQFCRNETLCEAPAYAAPAVAISTGEARTNDVVASLEAVQLRGLTPTGPALSGALAQARSWALEHPDRQVITVLATDGFPTDCSPQDIPSIAQLAGQAYSGEDPVRTFVIGVFSAADLGADGQANLDSWARAGGTEHAFVIDTSGDVAGEFLRALEEIRGTAVPCQFQLAGDATLAFDQVNLRVSDASGAISVLPNVGDATACGDEQGWYYMRGADGTPTRIQVCPNTCTRFTTAGASAELEVGCATRIR